MKKQLITVLCILTCLSLFAQTSGLLNHRGCGTVLDPLSKIKLNAFDLKYATTQYPDANPDSVYTLPIVFHVAEWSQAENNPTEADIQEALAHVNATYAPHKIQFENCPGENNFIQADEYYDTAGFPTTSSETGNPLSNDYFKVGALNIYVYRAFPRSAGFTSFYSSKAFVNFNSIHNRTYTLEHELGHMFGLYHTHGPVNAKRRGTYLTSELVQRTNCYTDGDKVCDTEADPYPSGTVRFNSLTTCYAVSDTFDANGDTFRHQLGNVMSYGGCGGVEYFTTGQALRARAGIVEHYSSLSCNYSCEAVLSTNDTVVNDYAFTSFAIGYILADCPLEVTGQPDWVTNVSRTTPSNGDRSKKILKVRVANNETGLDRVANLIINGMPYRITQVKRTECSDKPCPEDRVDIIPTEVFQELTGKVYSYDCDLYGFQANKYVEYEFRVPYTDQGKVPADVNFRNSNCGLTPFKYLIREYTDSEAIYKFESVQDQHIYASVESDGNDYRALYRISGEICHCDKTGPEMEETNYFSQTLEYDLNEDYDLDCGTPISGYDGNDLTSSVYETGGVKKLRIFIGTNNTRNPRTFNLTWCKQPFTILQRGKPASCDECIESLEYTEEYLGNDLHQVSWEPPFQSCSENNITYTFQYREKGSSSWITQPNDNQSATIMTDGCKEYEYKLSMRCGGSFKSFSPVDLQANDQSCCSDCLPNHIAPYSYAGGDEYSIEWIENGSCTYFHTDYIVEYRKKGDVIYDRADVNGLRATITVDHCFDYEFRIGFECNGGELFTNNYELETTDVPCTDLELISIDSPTKFKGRNYGEFRLPSQNQLVLTYRNNGPDIIKNIRFEIQNQNRVIGYEGSGNIRLLPGETYTHNFAKNIDLNAAGIHEFGVKVLKDNLNDSNPDNDLLVQPYQNLGNMPQSLPYIENFVVINGKNYYQSEGVLEELENYDFITTGVGSLNTKIANNHSVEQVVRMLNYDRNGSTSLQLNLNPLGTEAEDVYLKVTLDKNAANAGLSQDGAYGRVLCLRGSQTDNWICVRMPELGDEQEIPLPNTSNATQFIDGPLNKVKNKLPRNTIFTINTNSLRGPNAGSLAKQMLQLIQEMADDAVNVVKSNIGSSANSSCNAQYVDATVNISALLKHYNQTFSSTFQVRMFDGVAGRTCSYTDNPFMIDDIVIGYAAHVNTVVAGKSDGQNQVQVQEGLTEGFVLVYPNPFNTMLDVEHHAPIESIRIFDLAGKEVFKQQYAAESMKIELNLSDLQNGAYLLRVNDAFEQQIRVIKE